MSQLAVERVLGRLITDADFRIEFLVEPAAVCRDHGLELTPVELAALLRVDEQALQLLTAHLDQKIVRAMTLDLVDEQARPGVPQPPRDRRFQRGAR
jgi:hypothetical protein